MSTRYAGARAARIRVWDAPLRIFHWLLVVTIALAFLSSEEDSALNAWHIVAGWLAGLLIIFRIAWGFVGGEHSRFIDFVHPSRVRAHLVELLHGRPMPTLGHNPLGARSVLALLGLILATVLTGVTLREEAHEIVAWTLLAVVGLSHCRRLGDVVHDARQSGWRNDQRIEVADPSSRRPRRPSAKRYRPGRCTPHTCGGCLWGPRL